MNVHGTRSIQTLVDTLSKKLPLFDHEIFRLINQLTTSIKELSLVSINYT